jgi:hypothetical protein
MSALTSCPFTTLVNPLFFLKFLPDFLYKTEKEGGDKRKGEKEKRRKGEKEKRRKGEKEKRRKEK